MNINDQVEYLMQGTEYGDETLKIKMAEELRARLQACQKEGRVLRVYCGFDPTKADLHLGHTVPMRKLRQFQELGHDVTFVIGNYTSLIGDPSDKDVLRPQLTQQEVEANARTYAEQAFRILDPEKTHIRYNAEWLSELSFRDLIRLASNFTIQQFLTRENFKLRWEKGDPVYLHETFYSLMQGYDAFSLKTDVQVGGTDQLFNIMTASRKIMEFMGMQPNIAIILGILPGTDGLVRRVGHDGSAPAARIAGLTDRYRSPGRTVFAGGRVSVVPVVTLPPVSGVIAVLRVAAVEFAPAVAIASGACWAAL